MNGVLNKAGRCTMSCEFIMNDRHSPQFFFMDSRAVVAIMLPDPYRVGGLAEWCWHLTSGQKKNGGSRACNKAVGVQVRAAIPTGSV